MNDWRKVVVRPDTTLRTAIGLIDESSLQVALVLDAHGRLAGILTDGDIRRAILRGDNLDTATSRVMNPNSTYISARASREEMLALMRRRAFHHLPLVDESGIVTGLVTLDELVGAVRRPNWVVLMAGGLGTRLHPLTQHKPKPLLAIGNKPILETILESFVDQGFGRFFIAVNYKAEMIKEYFGDGARWGVELEYLHETSRMGTAGALSMLPGKPDAPLIVMNGDILTKASFEGLLDFHAEHRATATMAVREYSYQVPYGVVRLDGSNIMSIEEKPSHRCYVSAGIYALSPEALRHFPSDGFFDMPSLFEKLVLQGARTSAYPLREYWLDIGRLEEFEQAQKEWGGSAE